MKQTVLHRKHELLNAKMTEYQGWQIPLQFSDIQDEYHAVRHAVGLFDISYLGRIEVAGPEAPTLLQNITTSNLSKIREGSAHYGLICNDAGRILDDIFIHHLAAAAKTPGGRYLLSTNASNTEKILDWLKKHASGEVQIEDRSQATAQLSLQGPKSLRIMEKLPSLQFKKLKLRSIRDMAYDDTSVLVLRSGYTGEHGYEIIVPADQAEALWEALLTAGADEGILPCGFACRDVLRIEMGYLMYGYDIDETRTPVEAGLSRFIDFKKEFIGKDALQRIKADGPKQMLAGFVLLDKGVPKNGGSIYSENREIGAVTSGGLSPDLRKGIGLGYVFSRYAQAGQEIEIELRDREIAAKIVELPFYRKK
ncbi:MAG TPA: glycine cleavage system aminomethyltransferase GcvT [Nitrospirota bacterium]|nr:glycine cleavage system aminomethyltransferase GcvT [Nitrospirota bacterium]